jgi:hypothetical protein
MSETVLITGARAPVALHIARLLHDAGHRVIAADSLAHPLTAASDSIAFYEALPGPRQSPKEYGAALQKVIQKHSITRVVPTCEEVFYLAQLWAANDMDANLLAPNLETLADAHHKARFIDTCAAMGWPVPETTVLQQAEELEIIAAQARDLVFKPVWSRFASHVLIRPSPRRARRIEPSQQSPWIAQEYVTGEELCVYAIAKDGKLLTCAVYRGLVRAGAGAAVVFEPVEDANITRFVTKFVEHTGWTGQISFDLIRRDDGNVLPLECNPRATSGVHFYSDGPRFASALLGAEPLPEIDVKGPMGVRLAMWIYGLPHVASPEFREITRSTQDVLNWPGDPAPAKAQWRALAEIAAIALRKRMSLQRAATYDIEWDGPDQSSI